MKITNLTDSTQIKGPVKDFLLGNIGRRTFLNRLTALGLTATAARQYSQLVAAPAGTAAAAGETSSAVIEGTAGEIFVEQLKRCGVRFVFFNPSTGDYPVFDALMNRSDMQVVLALQEGVLTAMADGYAKASGKIPFVTCARPGFPNTLVHMFNAYKDRTPMVVAIDQSGETARGRWGFQEVDDLAKVAEPFTRWRWETRRPETMAEDIRRAFKFAATPPGGPVFLMVPSNILGTKSLKAEVIDQSQFTLSSNVRPDTGEVEEVARQLLDATSPALFVGSDIYRLGAEKEVVRLAELISLPVVQEPSRWTNSFPTDHPLYLGSYRANMRYPAQVDFLLNLGGLLPVPRGAAPAVPRSTRIAEVKFDVENSGRIYPSVLASPSSVKLFARDLIEALESRTTEDRRRKLRDTRWAQTEEFSRKVRESQEIAAQSRSADVPISHERLALELRANLDPQACVVHEVDSGSIALNYLTFGQDKMGYFDTTSAILGWGVGAAMGVKLAHPDRQVISLLGDGAFLFGGDQSLWTAKRYNIPIIIVVENNGAYDGERTRIWSRGGEQPKAGKDMTCFIGDPRVQFTKLAEAYGVASEQVTDPKDLGAALRRAANSTRDGEPYLLDVVISRRGLGADKIWYPAYSLAEERKRKV